MMGKTRMKVCHLSSYTTQTNKQTKQNKKTMFSTTSLTLRRRTPWRELLHPLPLRARQYLWWKRDRCDLQEEILRRPFYKLKPVAAADLSKRETMKFANYNTMGGPMPLDQDVVPRDVRLLKPDYPESFSTIPVTTKTGQR